MVIREEYITIRQDRQSQEAYVCPWGHETMGG